MSAVGLEVDYRDASYVAPGGRKRVRRTEAVYGGFRATGATKGEARAALLAEVAEHADHLYDRRYLVGIAHDGVAVTFAFYYCGGWSYDIVRADSGAHVCTTRTNAETTREEAYASMRRHFESYTTRAAEAVA